MIKYSTDCFKHYIGDLLSPLFSLAVLSVLGLGLLPQLLVHLAAFLPGVPSHLINPELGPQVCRASLV